MATRDAAAMRAARGAGGPPLTAGTLWAAAFAVGVAQLALGSANSAGYIICGIAGLVAALLVVAAPGGGSRNSMVTAEPPDMSTSR